LKLLVIKNDGLGDLILTSGIITWLAQEVASTLDLVTCEPNREIAEKITSVNQIYYVSRDSIREFSLLNPKRFKPPLRYPHDGHKLIRFNQSEQAVLATLNTNNYDLIIVLRRYIRQSSLLLLNTIQAKNKLCMWEFPTNMSFIKAKRLSNHATHINSYQLQHYIRPELAYYEAVLSHYFEKKCYANPSLTITHKDMQPQPLHIGLIISGASVTFSIPQLHQLLHELLANNFTITLLGAIEQKDLAEDLLKAFPAVTTSVGSVSFNEYPKLFSTFALILGNDTGLTHYASLFHNKVIVLLGGGTFKSFFPWRENGPQTIFYFEMPCYNCLWLCTHEEHNSCINKLFDHIPQLIKLIQQTISNKKRTELNLASSIV
jgi:ADP-heptose:LPS heptosyltransferase